MGEYSNGSATGAGRSEYIWLPTEDGQVIPVGMYRNGKFFAIHSDHLGTPPLITNEARAVVWQWPYSAFGNNKPTGVLKATANPKQALTIQPVLLKATAPIELRGPSGLFCLCPPGLCGGCLRQQTGGISPSARAIGEDSFAWFS